ncbi:MAG TPA: GNAT family N-acetyltransferase [Acidimicrobiia bacterium]|jgi:phosphinothricin acetyltransferase|nr:GNAT family N-acetyltransferase [Acidimicrobiia bacterium]
MKESARSDLPIVVRDCEIDDLPATLDIYNELIGSTTIAWSEQPQTLEERREWFSEQRRRGFVSLVAVDGRDVVGMSAFGDFRDSIHWPGYRFTAELSIHVRGDRRGRGIGRQLMDELVKRARAANLHVLVAGIDADNVESIRFHQQLGFIETARMPETGYKFGRRLDLVLMQRILGPVAEGD